MRGRSHHPLLGCLAAAGLAFGFGFGLAACAGSADGPFSAATDGLAGAAWEDDPAGLCVGGGGFAFASPLPDVAAWRDEGAPGCAAALGGCFFFTAGADASCSTASGLRAGPV